MCSFSRQSSNNGSNHNGFYNGYSRNWYNITIFLRDDVKGHNFLFLFSRNRYQRKWFRHSSSVFGSTVPVPVPVFSLRFHNFFTHMNMYVQGICTSVLPLLNVLPGRYISIVKLRQWYGTVLRSTSNVNVIILLALAYVRY